MSIRITSLEDGLLESNQDTAVRATEIGNLQKELESVQSTLSGISIKNDELLAENYSLQQQIVSLQSNLAEVTTSNEAEMENL